MLVQKRQLIICSPYFYETFPHVHVFLSSLVFNKTIFYEIRNFLILSAKAIFIKVLSVSKSLMKIKVTLHWKLFVILLISAVISKQRLLHEKNRYKIFKIAIAITTNLRQFSTRFVKRNFL